MFSYNQMTLAQEMSDASPTECKQLTVSSICIRCGLLPRTTRWTNFQQAHERRQPLSYRSQEVTPKLRAISARWNSLCYRKCISVCATSIDEYKRPTERLNVAVKGKMQASKGWTGDQRTAWDMAFSKYLASSSAAKILHLEMKHASTVGKGATPELSSDDLDRLLLILLTTYSNVAGLEPLGLGQCIKGRSFPQFSQMKSSNRFVQILNVGDHWFDEHIHDNLKEVFVYNSMASPVGVLDYIALLSTSLLRRYDDESATITFCVRQFQQQTEQTRLCGYYAAAAAVVLHAATTSTLLVSHLMKSFYSKKYTTE